MVPGGRRSRRALEGQFELGHAFDDGDRYSEAASDLDDGEAFLAASSPVLLGGEVGGVA
jgi:hypothetical protein